MTTFVKTNTGLDQLTDIILADAGLAKHRCASAEDILAGAEAANGMNALIIESIKATGVANDQTLSAGDVREMNAYLQANHAQEWVTLHGDDEGGVETGFHLVQNDGATSKLFDRNAVNNVADGIYHLGFTIEGGNFLNEDGDANVGVAKVAEWLNSLLATDLSNGSLANADLMVDYSTTGTGLDQLTDIILADTGLARKIATSDLREGAQAANSMNALIIESIKATGVANDQTLSAGDVREMNAYMQANHAQEWVTLHGDDEGGVETGFHLVQNDGATSKLFDRNAVNNVADGIYHLGFTIEGGNFLNEDGDANVRVTKVAEWLNTLLAEDLADGSLVGLVGVPTLDTSIIVA